MIKSSLIAAAALLAATPALAGEIRVPVAGRSPEVVRADVSAAALKVCNEALTGDALAIYMRDSCVRAVVSDALAQIPPAAQASAAPRSAYGATGS